VASPPATGARLHLLASQISAAVVPAPSTADIVLCSSGSPDPSFVQEAATLLGDALVRRGLGTDARTVDGGSFVVIRLATGEDVGALARSVRQVWEELPQRADIHPDVWDPIVLTPGVSLADVLERDAGQKYSYRELDDFTDRI